MITQILIKIIIHSFFGNNSFISQYSDFTKCETANTHAAHLHISLWFHISSEFVINSVRYSNFCSARAVKMLLVLSSTKVELKKK